MVAIDHPRLPVSVKLKRITGTNRTNNNEMTIPAFCHDFVSMSSWLSCEATRTGPPDTTLTVHGAHSMMP